MSGSTTEELAAKIQRRVGRLKSGSLRFWGVWFGRPHDNIHQITGADAQGNCLRIQFDRGEVLQVWNPAGCSADEQQFVIEQADRVRWEWFSYGRPRIPENLLFQDFMRDDDRVRRSSNSRPDFQHADISMPAVEIL